MTDAQDAPGANGPDPKPALTGSRQVPHWLRIEGVVRELYDVVALPGCRRPMAIGFQSDEIRRAISVGEAADTLR